MENNERRWLEGPESLVRGIAPGNSQWSAPGHKTSRWNQLPLLGWRVLAQTILFRPAIKEDRASLLSCFTPHFPMLPIDGTSCGAAGGVAHKVPSPHRDRERFVWS